MYGNKEVGNEINRSEILYAVRGVICWAILSHVRAGR